MKKLILIPILIILVLFSGCRTRSISNSEYGRYVYYPGELSELDVLGVNPGKEITEDDIQDALKREKHIALKMGDKVVLVQSGAQFPDGSMAREAEKIFKIVPLSGIPSNPNPKPYWKEGVEVVSSEEKKAPLDMSMRLAAAKAGASTIIVYWGVLESSRKGYATKTVSWVPIAGFFVPDENQQMRIRLKAAIIDVKTGDWEFMTPEVYEDERISSIVTRGESDQIQVEKLKEKAYTRLIQDIKTRYE